MRGTFRLALGALALATLATIGCRTSALRPLYQTSGTTGGLPATTPPPITLPSPTVPGQSTPPPTLPTTPQVADTSNFLDGGSLLGGTGGAGLSTPGPSTSVTLGTSSTDGGSFSSFGVPDSTGIGAPGTMPGTGMGGAGTTGFSPDGGPL